MSSTTAAKHIVYLKINFNLKCIFTKMSFIKIQKLKLFSDSMKHKTVGDIKYTWEIAAMKVIILNIE